MYVYRNSNTGGIYETPQRSARLDGLPNWLLIDAPDEQPAEPVTAPLARPSRPLDTDNKAAWMEYAISRGMPERDARALSKASLVKEFGQEEDDDA
ncbi:hypothetical protein [Nonomuraea cavernae]|uniref:Uncharacterized protein n=1 Tax=Nonomuraea cavernae TaxID=2045107 RepID=A0A917YQL8_9ACTN|nr:hypothetical protein [Nonomuraea cavernae]MCA2184642.1 hypothetical protein [Nonomuraea cavernae]GGO63196.1 hypothetical protein GCM10012289_09570 [Nonomuraea cavernae]